MLHFSQLWPLKPGQFLDKLKNAKTAVMIEGNAFGQMSRLIRRETGFELKKQVRRYDGLPITPEFIHRGLKEAGVR